ncbi:MAG: antibiotic biosynthesis monooxygenase family protein [Pyrinomonadaceae bacterium]
MIVAIVQHFVKSGMVERAEHRIKANGDRMATTPGFLFRQALVSSSDPQKLVTLTAWESREHYESWLEGQRADATGGASASAEGTPYVRVETEIFTVRRSDVGGQT